MNLAKLETWYLRSVELSASQPLTSFVAISFQGLKGEQGNLGTRGEAGDMVRNIFCRYLSRRNVFFPRVSVRLNDIWKSASYKLEIVLFIIEVGQRNLFVKLSSLGFSQPRFLLFDCCWCFSSLPTYYHVMLSLGLIESSCTSWIDVRVDTFFFHPTGISC